MDTTVTYRSLQHGEMLSWYRIEKILGHGGFGVIYLATDTNLDHQVAIKEYRALLDPKLPDDTSIDTYAVNGQSKQGLQRFIAEARNLVRFKHPNIVRVMSVFEANDTAYMVMEFEEGVDLRAHLKNPAHATEAALKALIKPVSEGLTEVHRHGFIHRDIKPANILVRKDASPVLLDFGSARNAWPVSEDPLTALVSAGYSPLEQYSDKSEQQQGPWTDIYALGAVLYYAISGSEPVDSAKRGSAILNGGHDPLVPAKMLGRGHYSDSFLEAIDWALQFRMDDRPQSLSDWIPALLRSTDRNDVTRLVDSAAQQIPGTTEESAGDNGAQNVARQGLHTIKPGMHADPLDGFSMRDQPAPREIEAARVKRISKRGLIGKTHIRGILTKLTALNVIASIATIALGFTLWQFRHSIGSAFDNTASVAGDQGTLVVPSPGVSVNGQVAAPNSATDIATEQARAANIAMAEEKAIAQRRATQLAEDKVAEEVEQKRIDALAEAAAIATTKQIAAQKTADEAAKQAEAIATENRRKQEAAAEQARLSAVRRQFNVHLQQASLEIDRGQLTIANKTLDKAAALNSGDSRLAAARVRWRLALADSLKPVSDADFDRVIEQFDRLRRALESNDASTMSSLTESSRQNGLFTQLMASFARLEISISNIRVRNANKSITATLRIEHMVRSNGDRATPSTAYRERTIVSQRIEGQWSKIRW